MKILCPHCRVQLIVPLSVASKIFGAAGGNANTEAQARVRAQAKPGAGRPTVKHIPSRTTGAGRRKKGLTKALCYKYASFPEGEEARTQAAIEAVASGQTKAWCKGCIRRMKRDKQAEPVPCEAEVAPGPGE